jgi:hypothetical protein
VGGDEMFNVSLVLKNKKNHLLSCHENAPIPRVGEIVRRGGVDYIVDSVKYDYDSNNVLILVYQHDTDANRKGWEDIPPLSS